MLEFLLSGNASRVSDYKDSLNFVFANTQEEESIYLILTMREIAEAQSKDTDLK
jgi:hypothetical protein